MAEIAAELRGVSKSYAGVEVLRGIDFAVRRGEIHALLGGNGAGKSTLMKILAGLVAPTRGEIRVGGVAVANLGPARAQAMGVYLAPQEAHIFPNLRVLDNVCIGLPGGAGDYRERVAALVAGLGVSLDLGAQGATLEIADRQIVEILRGLVREAQVLILDEPTSALTPHEVSALFRRLRQLREAGVGMVFISHKLPELRAISDRITVLRDGVVALSAPMADCADADILAAMSPALRVHEAGPRGRVRAGEALRADGLSGEGFAGVTLGVGAGEIVGLAGLVGAGRTEFAETLVGLRPVRAGRVAICGRPAAIASPRAAMEAGLVLLSEDRQLNGLFLDAPLFWNTSALVSHRLPMMLRPGAERARFDADRKAMGIVCAGPDQRTGTLSGGNQQKLLLSRCLAAEPRALVLDEPTRGVDVGARNDIYGLIEALAEAGAGILLISSDFDEITRLSDRILVMAEGRIAGELPGGVSPDAIAELAFQSGAAIHA